MVGRRETLEFEGLHDFIQREKWSAKEAVVTLIKTELNMDHVTTD